MVSSVLFALPPFEFCKLARTMTFHSPSQMELLRLGDRGVSNRSRIIVFWIVIIFEIIKILVSILSGDFSIQHFIEKISLLVQIPKFRNSSK